MKQPATGSNQNTERITVPVSPEPADWFDGVNPDDGLAGLVARLLLMRYADAGVFTGYMVNLLATRGTFPSVRSRRGRLSVVRVRRVVL
jgi:hypothetical protein